MRGVRGANKSPGAYRRIPNWIGPPSCDREEARFVPIAADRLPQAMDAWERYIHSKTPDRLVQLAVLHAEFEALHPFLDGNGRLGRMLVPLFLWQAELIRAPVFYMSAHLEAHRDTYYDRLLAVSRDDDWTGWCHFFLEAIQQRLWITFAKIMSDKPVCCSFMSHNGARTAPTCHGSPLPEAKAWPAARHLELRHSPLPAAAPPGPTTRL